MTIAIDASRAINESAGIGRFTKCLVESMLKTDSCNRYILIFTYFKKSIEKERIIKGFKQDNVEIRTAKIPGNIKESLWGKNIILYNNLYRGAEVLLAPSFFEFKKGLKIPQVVVIHDLATFLYPDQRGSEVSKRLSQRAILACEKSEKVIAISQSTKQGVFEHIKISEDKIRVIYPGLTKFDNIADKLPNNITPQKYILFVGTLEPRKNLKKLLTAYSELPTALKQKYSLVIVGAIGWNVADVLKIKKDKLDSNIIFLDFQPDDVLAKLYKEAAVFCYPSLYEGFGLPVIEALQFGTPVVTSNRSSLPEAVGNAGILVEPDDPKSIAGGLQRVLEGKIDKEELMKEAKVQTAKFSWEKAAEKIIKVLEEVDRG